MTTSTTIGRHESLAYVTTLQIFFEYAGCRMIGEFPTCNGCEHNQRTPCGTACTHPEHPENASAYREMKFARA